MQYRVQIDTITSYTATIEAPDLDSAYTAAHSMDTSNQTGTKSKIVVVEEQSS